MKDVPGVLGLTELVNVVPAVLRLTGLVNFGPVALGLAGLVKGSSAVFGLVKGGTVVLGLTVEATHHGGIVGQFGLVEQKLLLMHIALNIASSILQVIAGTKGFIPIKICFCAFYGLLRVLLLKGCSHKALQLLMDY